MTIRVAINGYGRIGRMILRAHYESGKRHDLAIVAIYLRREFQHVGLGRRLVAAVVDAQSAYGATGLLTWVIAGNKPARAFYERLGGELLVEQPFQWDGMDLVEAGYGWRDLPALAEACRDEAIAAKP